MLIFTVVLYDEAMSLVSDSARVDESVSLGRGCRIWEFAQVREGTVLGEGCVVGKGAYIGAGVKVGRHVKIQNNAMVYEPARLGDGVFIGPGAVLTNDTYPRAVNPDGTPKNASDWQASAVIVGEGASIGANVVCVAPVKIGRWAVCASGSVVVRDVPDYALVAGVPASQIGWVGKSGKRLERLSETKFVCRDTGQVFRLVNDVLQESLKS